VGASDRGGRDRRNSRFRHGLDYAHDIVADAVDIYRPSASFEYGEDGRDLGRQHSENRPDGRCQGRLFCPEVIMDPISEHIERRMHGGIVHPGGDPRHHPADFLSGGASSGEPGLDFRLVVLDGLRHQGLVVSGGLKICLKTHGTVLRFCGFGHVPVVFLDRIVKE